MSRPLETGMLLFVPQGVEGEHTRPKVYTVKSAGKRSATLIAHYESMHETARLRMGTVPNGWVVINNAALAANLQTKHEAQQTNPPAA